MALAGDAVIFSIGAHSFDWEDVKTAAVAWGEWARVAEKARAGLACVAFLSADEAEISGDELDAAAESYREDRNLIAAEEISAWLDARGLDAEGWLSFLERMLARQRCAEGIEEIVRDFPVDDEAVAESLHAEIVCSGVAGAVAHRLAAAASSSTETGETPPPSGSGERSAWVREACAAFAAIERETRSDANLEKALALHPLDWMVVEARVAHFDSEDAAREAILCVSEENADLGEVAETATAEICDVTRLVQEIDPAIHGRLVAAKPGEIIGPYPVGERFALLLVVAKSPPRLDHPRVRAEAEQQLLASLVEHRSRDAHFLLEP